MKKLNWFLCVIGILFFLSCSIVQEVREVSSGAQIIENVPFNPQEDFQCGPSSLAMVLNYHGIQVTPHEIAKEVFSGSARGTLTLDMVMYAQNSGLEAQQFRGDIEDLRKNIDSGLPVIVLVDYGFFVYQGNHFMVVLGYSESGVIVNSGRSREKFIAWGKFLRTWEKTHFWTLAIRPSSKIQARTK